MRNTSQINKIITAVIMVTEAFLHFSEDIKQATTIRIWVTKQLNESKQLLHSSNPYCLNFCCNTSDVSECGIGNLRTVSLVHFIFSTDLFLTI